jgi:choline kinase
MSSIKNAIISAAGMGTRLGLNIPKCLLKFNGISIIEHQLKLLKDIESVRVVVGFMEEDVIKTVKFFRNDVIFVRNPDYQKTSNTYSISLATKNLKEPYLLLDGDLLINKRSFNNFVNFIDKKNSLVGITEASTDDAVYVKLNKKNEVVSFSRKNKSEYEWSGIACLNGISVNKKKPYLYQTLEKHLPLQTKYIECSEIDTAEDLKRAQQLWPRYFGK